MPQPPQINSKWAQALGWYNHNNNSLITQEISLFPKGLTITMSSNALSIVLEGFKELLNHKKPKNDDAKTFLEYLGFKVNNNGDYSDNDVTIIANQLTFKPTNEDNPINTGTISVNNSDNDFMVALSTMAIDIIKVPKLDPSRSTYTILNTYTIKLTPSNLEIKKIILDDIFKNMSPIDILLLDEITNFNASQSISNFKLQFKSANNQLLWNDLIKLLNVNVTLIWSSDLSGQNLLTVFPIATNKAYLKITASNVDLTNVLDCRNPKP